MNFDTEGPFKLKRHGPKKLINKDTQDALPSALDEFDLGLSDACGCYVFTVRAGMSRFLRHPGVTLKKRRSSRVSKIGLT